jgi:hypothetical protein
MREARNWQKPAKNKALRVSPINAATKPIIKPTIKPTLPAGWRRICCTLFIHHSYVYFYRKQHFIKNSSIYEEWPNSKKISVLTNSFIAGYTREKYIASTHLYLRVTFQRDLCPESEAPHGLKPGASTQKPNGTYPLAAVSRGPLPGPLCSVSISGEAGGHCTFNDWHTERFWT